MLPRIGEQSICTPDASRILGFLMEAKSRKQRIVALTAGHVPVTSIVPTHYIVILGESVRLVTEGLMASGSPRERDR